MTLSYDSKEDLRLQMADLEKKLAESEEERCKLEKTCNVLMRAFREEEKIRYKALNKSYEKFLQDCTVRKRRNDIILRSLCRIEDRSRALFAKTERLKLLKDRYISYLKISDFKDGVSSHARRTLPSSSPSQKTTGELTPKFVQWKTPLATDHRVEDHRQVEENSVRSNKTSDVIYRMPVSGMPYASPEKLTQEQREVQDQGIPLPRNADDQNKLPSIENRLESRLGNTETPSNKSEELIGSISRKKPEIYYALKNNISNELEVKDLAGVTISGERNSLSRQESIEKLKKSLSFEEEFIDKENINERHDLYNKKITNKYGTEENEKSSLCKENNSHDVSFPKNNNYFMNSGMDSCEEEKEDPHDDVGTETKTGSPEENISSHGLPMGLDGVDYQNETYPESYYEQPVHHHNHTSIVADVILEEDETEQDVDEEERDPFGEDNHGPNTWKESPDHRNFSKPEQSRKIATNELTDTVHDLNEKAIDEVKSQESVSGKLPETKPSDFDGNEPKTDRSDRLSGENSEKKKNVRSNLIHLLESDSESFQIEHGDGVSGNEDSDFDFSFH